MIVYPSGIFGIQILFRLRGSAVFRSIVPALISSVIYTILYHYLDLEEDDSSVMDHPYPMGALLSAFTFLLSFRANFSYNRYWEAFTSVHAMHSKWLDVGTDLAAFHLQSKKFDNDRPPAFGQYPELTSIERERERNEQSFEEIRKQVDEEYEKDFKLNHTSRFARWRLRVWRRRRNQSRASTTNPQPVLVPQEEEQKKVLLENVIRKTRKNINAPVAAQTGGTKKKKIKAKGHRRVVSSAVVDTKAPDKMDKRSLFLQEAAHLLSLLSAVAMSTLRNDLENAESPLVPFIPGSPLPCVDPDGITADIRTDWEFSHHERFPTLRYLLGMSRSETARALYNAARPFRVIGGVSDNEVLLLQACRGPQAKVNLVSLWVQEFIAREHLSGGTGKVEPPIISRLFQFVSDGLVHYNQARKVAYIPFPFPHAQITSIFVLVIVAMTPILMLSFVRDELVGFLLNLLTVMCFTGLHEVSRELENPFQNAPNDLPANNLHSQYNEALMSIFAGYHPDAKWEIKETPVVPEENESLMRISSMYTGQHEGNVVAAAAAAAAAVGEDESGQSIEAFPLDSVTLNDLVAGLNISSEGQELEGIASDQSTEEPTITA